MFIFMTGSREFSSLKNDEFYLYAFTCISKENKKNEEDLCNATDSSSPDGRILQSM